MQELTMTSSVREKALDFVDCALSLQTKDIQAIVRDDLLCSVKDFYQIQRDFQRRKVVCHVDIVYHHLENLESVLENGLFSRSQHKGESGIPHSDGIYCSSDPFIFFNQRHGGTVIMLARMKAFESPNFNSAGTTVKPYTDQFVPLKGFCIIQSRNQCVPLFRFPSRLLENRDGRFEQQLAGFNERVQRLLIEQFLNGNTPSEFRKHKDDSLFVDGKLPTAKKATTPINIRKDDRARRKFMKSQAFKAYRALCVSEHRNKAAVRSNQMVFNLQPLWSHMETPGMREAKCSLLIQDIDSFHPQVKRLAKQNVPVYQDRGYIPDIASRDDTQNEDEDFVVDFEGCTILQLEPSRGIRTQTMPTTLTVGGRCVFTPENFRDFRVMMRTKEQAKDMNLLPNGDFDWPGVESLQLCPLCGRSAEVPREGDNRNHEYWLLFYPLLQITIKEGSQMVLGSRMICRLTCLSCMHKLLGKTTCEVCPPLLHGRRSRTSFQLPTKEVLGEAGSVSFLEGGPSRPETIANSDDVLDAWTLYNLWEHSGAWEALQNDYRLSLSKSMGS